MQHRTRLSHLTSRVSGVALGVALSGAIASTTSKASAQAFPFPSTNVQPSNSLFITPVLTTHELRAQYALWKQRFLDMTCQNNEIRVKYPESTQAGGGVPNDTRSEAIGYGMLISAYMGDLQTFQGLRNFYFDHTRGTGLMDWLWTDCTTPGQNGQGSAADADIDAAMSLIVADKQWPGMNFGTDASTLLRTINSNLFDNNTCSGLLLAGSQFKACGCLNASYMPTGYYPAFASADTADANAWNTARTNSYTFFQRVQSTNGNSKLISAWAQNTGSVNLQCPAPPQVSGGGQSNQFQADAARVPWRVSVDYAWSGNASAKTFLSGIATFAKSQPIVSVVDVYNLDGTPQQGTANGVLDADGSRNTFVMGGFASALMSSSQEDVDSFTGAWQSMYLPGDSVAGLHAFNSSLALLYGLNVTGLMWNPAGPNPTPVTEPTLNDQPGNLLTNGDFDEGFQGWSFANLQPNPYPMAPEANRAQGYAMHRDGELQIRIQRAAPVATNSYEIRLSQPVSIQAGQNYKISLKARSANPRSLHVNVEGTNGVIASLGNHQDAKAPVMTTADMLTYDWVFASTAAATANFEVDSGDSAETLIIDDVVLAPTTDPVSVAGDQAGQTPPGSTDGTTPASTGGGAPGGGGAATPGGTTGQTIPNQGDLGSTSGGSPVAGSQAGVAAAAAPSSSGGLSGNGTCTTDADCGGFKCSTTISLCYDPTTGYVWDQKSNGGQGGWTQPPMTDACKPYVFWPTLNGCYDPVSGYGYNPTTNSWQFVGEQYQANNTGKSSGGCSVSGVGENTPAPAWALFGMLGTAFGLAYRRRR